MKPGGFNTLCNKGAWFPDCRNLASGFSATGLATVATGAWPAQHGIVAESWYDRGSKTRVRADEEALLATTLTDEAAENHARVFVVAMDARHARLFAGAAKADLYWMDERGQFQNNGTAPDWLKAFNERKSPEALHNARWTVPGVRADAPPLRTLKYDAAHPEQFLELYRASPYGQEAQFDLVNDLLREGLGQGSTTDILCFLEGSMELLGEDVGGRSPLMDQMLLQLDRRLEGLLQELTKATGEGGFNLVLTAAHGAPDAVPVESARARMAVDGEVLARRIDSALSLRGMGRVEKFLYPFLYLDTSGFRDPEEIRKAAGRAALDHPAVADYYTAGGASSAQDEWQQRFRNSFHARRSGDLMLSYRPQYVEDFGQGRGVSYGSLYNYDANVPLFFYGPQFRAGVFERTVESVDVAPTLARVLGIANPSSATGRVLYEALV